jgi:hypothetical protein
LTSIFREVWIGGVSKGELLQNLKDKNIHINEYGLQIINHENFITSAAPRKIETVEISTSDLGFPKGATTKELYDQAEELGYTLCPPELAPHIRLQYMDQPIDPPKGHWQNIAMSKISEEPGFPSGFYLRHREDGFWLRGYRASTDYLWQPEDRFIFVLTAGHPSHEL